MTLSRRGAAAPSTPPPLPAGARIVLRDIRVRYGDRLAVDGVSFSARAGEMVALVGPNGSGKSSLLRATAGLLRCAGHVRCEGRVGFLPQDNGARAALTVMETVLLGRIRVLGMRVGSRAVVCAPTAWTVQCLNCGTNPGGALVETANETNNESSVASMMLKGL